MISKHWREIIGVLLLRFSCQCQQITSNLFAVETFLQTLQVVGLCAKNGGRPRQTERFPLARVMGTIPQSTKKARKLVPR